MIRDRRCFQFPREWQVNFIAENKNDKEHRDRERKRKREKERERGGERKGHEKRQAADTHGCPFSWHPRKGGDSEG